MAQRDDESYVDSQHEHESGILPRAKNDRDCVKSLFEEMRKDLNETQTNVTHNKLEHENRLRELNVEKKKMESFLPDSVRVEENTNMNAEYERCSTTGSKNDEKSKNETHVIEAGGFLETFKDLGGKTVQATQLKKNKKKGTDDERTSSMDKMSKSEARGIEPGDYKEKFKEFAATAVEPTQNVISNPGGDVEHLKASVKEKQKEMLRLEKEKTDMAAKAARQEELEKEVEKLNQEKEKNQELLSEYFKQFGNLNSQIEGYKHRMDTYERQQNDMRRELLDKERQMSMMAGASNSTSNMAEENEMLKQQFEELKSQISSSLEQNENNTEKEIQNRALMEELAAERREKERLIRKTQHFQATVSLVHQITANAMLTHDVEEEMLSTDLDHVQ